MPVVNLKSSNNRTPLAEGTWDAVIIEVNAGESSNKKTPYVEFVYQVQDADAVDTDGKAYKGRVWDKYFFSENATWRFKKVVKELGVEDLPDDDEDVDLDELASHVGEQVLGNDVKLTTSIREYEGKSYVDVKNVESA